MRFARKQSEHKNNLVLSKTLPCLGKSVSFVYRKKYEHWHPLLGRRRLWQGREGESDTRGRTADYPAREGMRLDGTSTSTVSVMTDPGGIIEVSWYNYAGHCYSYSQLRRRHININCEWESTKCADTSDVDTVSPQDFNKSRKGLSAKSQIGSQCTNIN